MGTFIAHNANKAIFFMPRTKDDMESVETSVHKTWITKMKRVGKRQGKSTRRQYIRDLIYADLKKEGEL